MSNDYYRARARYALALSNIAEHLQKYGIGRPEQKSVNEVVRSFDDTLTRFCYEAFNGSMSGADFSRSLRALLRSVADEAYSEGMREGGVKDPDEVLDDKDEQTIKGWLATQLEHVRDFADAANDVRGADDKESARRAVLDRVDLWAQSLQVLGNLGFASAKRNMMVAWRYGDTEHCDTCNGLNGKRRRLKWFVENGYIPREPGSETLDCGGYNCQCSLVDDDGKVIMP